MAAKITSPEVIDTVTTSGERSRVCMGLAINRHLTELAFIRLLAYTRTQKSPDQFVQALFSKISGPSWHAQTLAPLAPTARSAESGAYLSHVKSHTSAIDTRRVPDIETVLSVSAPA